ncbi:MAG: hypothetical protein JXR60_08440 [Bacteroidales bacterium]|nr:hypothetical protein [Bacteroidales bacterium]
MSIKYKLFLVASLFFAIFVNSCKDPEPPKAVVTVRNGFDENKVVSSAIVTVYVGEQSGKPGYVNPDEKTIQDIQTTDASGQCSFEFKFENILNVKAELPFEGDTLYGEGVLVLEEDKTDEETIYLRRLKSQL